MPLSLSMRFALSLGLTMRFDVTTPMLQADSRPIVS
jgi:hypothetical protein